MEFLGDAQVLVRQYIGQGPVVKISEGRQSWCLHLYLIVKLHEWVDAQRWTYDMPSLRRESNIHALATSVEQCFTGFYGFKAMCEQESHGIMEILVELQTSEDDEVFLKGGLAVPREVDLERLAALLHQEFHYTASEINISRIPESFLARRWVRRVGGHGYMARTMWMYGLPFTFMWGQAEMSFNMGAAIPLWEERREDGCEVNSSCRCKLCRDDVDHSACKESCPFKHERGIKQKKAVKAPS